MNPLSASQFSVRLLFAYVAFAAWVCNCVILYDVDLEISQLTFSALGAVLGAWTLRSRERLGKLTDLLASAVGSFLFASLFCAFDSMRFFFTSDLLPRIDLLLKAALVGGTFGMVVTLPATLMMAFSGWRRRHEHSTQHMNREW